MHKRAEEEERALKERAEIEARERDERERRVANELLSQLQDDARRKEDLQRLETERRRARRRALSDATEKPNLEVSIASFDQEVVIGDVRFDTVRLFHGRQGMRITINYKLNSNSVLRYQNALERHMLWSLYARQGNAPYRWNCML